TCFCASLGAGPMSESGFDLALTELIDGGEHEFIVDVGSDRGRDLIAEIARRPADASDLERRRTVIEHAVDRMTRRLPARGLKALLQQNPEHPRWAETAERCLSCANCTMVCPTCFCSTVEDTTDLSGATAERVRKWDSCFTMDFSYIVGGSTRPSVRARYRHWLTHKLANWQDQFGVLGCTGCGRCITWCPVGIDLTEEVAAIGAGAPPQAAEEI
ncbi:MAG: sulfite reductase subunit A, partial [Planctomycetota bacterium]